MQDVTEIIAATPKTFDKVNIGYGVIAGFFAAIFGQFWILFAGFLVFNFIDLFTGWYKAYLQKKLSSATGFQGAMRKVFYWVVIGIAFYVSRSFEMLGATIGVNLSFVAAFGWLTLATYLINEIRSILENLVEIGVTVPDFLVKGLRITEKLMDAKAKVKEDNNDEL